MSQLAPIVVSDRGQLSVLQTRVLAQIEVISRVEHENIVRRLFIGLALQVIKDSLPHGKFLPWLKGQAAGYTQCTYMMRLAREWREHANLRRTEVEALPRTEFALDTKDAAMRKLVGSAEKFVGKLSWTELLQKHGIKDGGKLDGARTKGPGTKDEGVPDEEQMYLFARDEIGGVLAQAETLLVKENRLQFLAKHPEEVRGVVESLRALADKVEQAAKPLLK
ncbi:MAG: hypothetical protein HZA93_23730 [Verrucomicrobia bacterium]|nr:hypothetical protein [Verrucomicrobiota bacterium]